ncbi:MAG: MarR family winged helix-turn-helix transcriptional regulator [Chloroflexaceae bacterium]
MSPQPSQHYRMFHDIYVLLDDGDRRVLRTFNLSPSQFAVLLLLDREAGWRLTDLSERLLVDKSTITRIIDRLESAGLVRREADPDDRRVQRVVLTGQGQETRDRARTAHERSIERRMGALDPDEQRQLLALLTRLRDGLQADLVNMAATPSE